MTALLFLMLSVTQAEAPSEEAKKELAKLQGTWKAIALETFGSPNRPLESSPPATHKLLIAGNDFSLGSSAGKVKLQPQKSGVEFVATHGPLMGRTRFGSYTVDGNTLELSLDDRPPNDANAPQYIPQQRWMFERDKNISMDDTVAAIKDRLPDLERAARARMARPENSGELLLQIIEKLDRIEKRLETLEKNTKE